MLKTQSGKGYSAIQEEAYAEDDTGSRWIYEVNCSKPTRTTSHDGYEYALVDGGAQIHACPKGYPGKKVALKDPGVYTASGQHIRHYGGRLVTYDVGENTKFHILYHECDVKNPVIAQGRLLRQGFKTKFEQNKGTLIDPKTGQSTHLVPHDDLFFLRGRLVAPIEAGAIADESMINLGDETAAAFSLPQGPQPIDEVEEPEPVRPATLRSPGAPEPQEIEMHNLTHFPSKPWCSICVEARGHDSPHTEQPHVDAVIPVLQFDYGYMGDTTDAVNPPACFLVGADTSSGAYMAVQVPMLEGGKKVEASGDFLVPHVTTTVERWIKDLGYTKFLLHGDKEGTLQASLDKVAKNVCPPDQQWQILRRASPVKSSQSSGGAEKGISTIRGLARTYLSQLKKNVPPSPSSRTLP